MGLAPAFPPQAILKISVSLAPVRNINIAIDGFAGCGKSTTAREVARQLGYLYIDTGAMYRAVSLYFLRNGIPFEQDNPHIAEALSRITLDFAPTPDGKGREITLNGERVEAQIRTPEVSAAVSPVSVHKAVRQELVRQQQRMALHKGVVMDGRDIGTVVLPGAELKIFMTATPEARAERRLEEMQAKGQAANREQVLHNLLERDRIDSSREEGPLRQAEDALLLDTTLLSIPEQVESVLELAKAQIFAVNSVSA